MDVLQGLDMPAVLVEVGFLDHAEEGPFLLSPEGKKTVQVRWQAPSPTCAAASCAGRKSP